MRRLLMLGRLVVVGFLCVASTLQMQAQAQQPLPIPQATKPQRITTQVLWTGTRANAAVEIAAAQALTKRGADVLVATTDGSAVAQWVESKHLQVRVIGWHVDQSSVAPRAQAAAVALDWTPFCRTAINESFDYWCTKSDTSRGFAEGAIKMDALSGAMSNAAGTRLNAVQAALLRRDFQVFVGPLYSSTGAALLGRGDVGDEAWQLSQRALLHAVTEISLPTMLAVSSQSVRWGKH